MKEKKCEDISRAHERLCKLRKFIKIYETTIEKAKEDISSCILHGLTLSDFVPFEDYTFACAISSLDDARYVVRKTAEEIRSIKKSIADENRKLDISKQTA